LNEETNWKIVNQNQMQEKRNGNPCKIDKQMLETFHIL
jgi:hypothetical protein